MPENRVDATDLDRQIADMVGVPEQEPEVKETPPEPAKPAPAESHEPTPPGEPVEANRLTAALKTIESLTSKISELETRFSTAPPRAEREAPRPEPSIEFEEVLGRRIPRDPSRRPIKLKADDLLRLGWNDDPAKALEAAANAFFDFILEAIPQYTTQTWDQRSQAERARAEKVNYFWNEHQDLKGLEPFVQTVEQMSLQDGTLNPQAFRSHTEYASALGRRVREKVAAMRGQSLDQYLASVSAKGATRQPASRAVTTGGGSPARTPKPTPGDQQKEIDDLVDNR